MGKRLRPLTHKAFLFMEVWKDVKDYEGMYQISNFGRVKSLERIVKNGVNSNRLIKERILKNHISKTGYFVTDLKDKNYRKTFKIHILISKHFIKNHKNLPIINHIDGNKLNNNIYNLEWVSQRENCCHKELKNNNSSKYIGVCYRKNRNKWQSSIVFNGKLIHLGTFKTEIEAYQKRCKFEKDNNIINKYL
jgi:hypothetical protein